jgi:hypothetical protein
VLLLFYAYFYAYPVSTKNERVEMKVLGLQKTLPFASTRYKRQLS